MSKEELAKSMVSIQKPIGDYPKKSEVNPSVTVVTNCLMADGIGRQGIGLLGAIKNDFPCNAWVLQTVNPKDVPLEVLPILTKPFDGKFGKITFWTYILGINDTMEKAHAASTSELKICYTMIESDGVPPMWVKFLNKYYDMVVVPDPWLIKVYQNAGVTKPIFVVPLGVMLERFLDQPLKTESGKPFTFGLSAGFWERKNHIKLLSAFKKKFANNPEFKLKLHGRFGPYRDQVEAAVKQANLSNVELSVAPFTQKDYLSFMTSLDCYVFPSKGEGFSITPRESIALGIPCVLTNNSVHKTIIQSGLVTPVACPKATPAFYEVFKAKYGNFYDCSEDELAKAMVDVADNYPAKLEQLKGGRDWVKQYLWSSVTPLYHQLFKPSKVWLGTQNKVSLNGVETTSKELIKKYEKL